MQTLTSHALPPRTNLMLAAVPDETWRRWAPHVQPVQLAAGAAVGHPDASPAYAIFPVTAIISLMCTTHEGGTVEIGLVGPEGVVGLPLVQGCADTSGRPVVQAAGLAYQLRSNLVADEIQKRGELLDLLLRYGQVMLAQVVQTALCNRHHTIDQQLCRRLLLGLDRTPTNEVAMTHATIANGLGVRREGVSQAAYKLQHAGVIQYQRGRIHVLDRRELERRACGCYWAARREQDRLFPASATTGHLPVPAPRVAISAMGRRLPLQAQLAPSG